MSEITNLTQRIHKAIDRGEITDMYIDFETFVVNTIEAIDTQDPSPAFDFFNDLANLKNDTIDNMLDACLFENLYYELGDNETKFKDKLNKRSLKLYLLAVYIRNNPSTPEEIILHQKSLGL
ncbi:hypothetical protein FUA48_12365 [Flavobacterium alkalisoli]|uniref:Uncharacterized protein n=1 Tax=Flavobacterium alkalisoli TaxID=2602769 RepID=A0A5B9FZD8_9FLAO|nr:hypothetical protein [Flavobacterium alkalisoli]QEE50342.1 hypothetical protein FUA48_12365 [Flavobacterium alkalisoli]